MSKSLERKSAPPKMTQPKGFNLNTERRGNFDRKNLHIENPKLTGAGFKSRPMPSFPDPPSPTRSSRSFQFNEFNLTSNMRERKSAPPLKQPNFSKIRAREMPDFNKNSFKPMKTAKDLTIPNEFELVSLRRHEVAR